MFVQRLVPVQALHVHPVTIHKGQDLVAWRVQHKRLVQEATTMLAQEEKIQLALHNKRVLLKIDPHNKQDQLSRQDLLVQNPLDLPNNLGLPLVTIQVRAALLQEAQAVDRALQEALVQEDK